jgi:phosphoribosylformylglycinamidine synthase
MADAAKALGIPVISGNVSLYNETNGEAIWPTPVVGVVGMIEDVDRVVPMGFQVPGDTVFLVFPPLWEGRVVNGQIAATFALRGAEIMRRQHEIVAGVPEVDLSGETRLHRFLFEAHRAECCIAGRMGARIAGGIGERWDMGLFGESQSFLLISCDPSNDERLDRLAQEFHVGAAPIGMVGGNRQQATDESPRCKR